LASAGTDHALIIWDAASAVPERELRAEPAERGAGIRRRAGIEHGFAALAFSPNGQNLAAGNRDGSVHLWEVRTWKLLWRQAWLGPQQVPHITGIAFSPDGKSLAVSADHLAFLRLCDAATGKVQTEIDVSSGRRQHSVIFSSFGATLAFSADGDLICADGGDGTLRRWHTRTGNELNKIEPDNWHGGFHMGFSPDGLLATTSARKNPLKLWNLENGDALQITKTADSLSYRVAFSPDGRYLAICGGVYMPTDDTGDKNVELLELASGKVVCILRLPRGTGVNTVAFSRDGRKLVTGLTDTTTIVWDIEAPALAGNSGQLEDRWSLLAGDDATLAWQVIRAMATTPAQTVAFVAKRFEAKPVNRELVLQLVAELDSNQFSTREKAIAKLKELGPEVNVILGEVLAANPSLEVSQRLKKLRASFQETLPPAELLRGIRAVAVLERIGTPEAKKLLGILAKGSQGNRLGKEASGALQRLGL
jgi:WD40 repeat protein